MRAVCARRRDKLRRIVSMVCVPCRKRPRQYARSMALAANIGRSRTVICQFASNGERGLCVMQQRRSPAGVKCQFAPNSEPLFSRSTPKGPNLCQIKAKRGLKRTSAWSEAHYSVAFGKNGVHFLQLFLKAPSEGTGHALFAALKSTVKGEECLLAILGVP